MITTDTHLHTPLCKHADGRPEDYVEAARAAGLARICFTDHMPDPSGYDSKWRMDSADFPRYVDAVRALAASVAPTVGLGIEADYYQGCEPYLSQWLPEQAFDVVLGSVHYIDNWGFDGPEGRKRWASVDVTGAWRRYFEREAAMIRTGLYDVVSHLDLPKKFGFRPPDRALREMAAPVMDLILESGMAIEINTAGLRKPVGEIYPSPLLLSLAAERSIPIVFGSDAHRPDEVAAAFDQAEALAREAGYREYVVYDRRRPRRRPL